MTITVLVRYSWEPQVIINRISKMLIWITMTTVQISIIFSLLHRCVAFQTSRRPNTTLSRIWHDHMIGNAVRQTCVAANIYLKWNNTREHAMPSHRQKRRRCLCYTAGMWILALLNSCDSTKKRIVECTRVTLHRKTSWSMRLILNF